MTDQQNGGTIALPTWFVVPAAMAVSPAALPMQAWVDQELAVPGMPPVKVVLPDGKPGLLLRMCTPGSLFGNVVDSAFAVAFGEELVRKGKATQSGLIVVN